MKLVGYVRANIGEQDLELQFKTIETYSYTKIFTGK